MAEGAPDSPLKEDKKHTKQQRIMIIVGVVGLLLTVLLLRRASASSSSSGDSETMQQEAADQQNIAALGQALQSIQAQMATEIPYSSSGSSIGGSTGVAGPAGPQGPPGKPGPAYPNPTNLPVKAGQLPVLAKLQASLFPKTLTGNSPMDVLGSISSKGGGYTGYNVSGGAPVYAEVNGIWEQGVNLNNLPVGTKIATLEGLSPYVGSKKVTEHI